MSLSTNLWRDCIWLRSMTSSASAVIAATTRCQQPMGQSAFVHLTEIKDRLFKK